MSSLRNNSKFQSPAKGVSPAKNASANRSTGFGVSAKSSKGMQSSNEFSRQIKNAQSHAGEDIEDEYIKNLQQQIAYMELELKLLKEKELEQKQSVSQIDKFFNDGVPLNENILALKNQYQHGKKQFENRIDELNELRMEEMKQSADLKNNYERSHAALKTIIEALDKKEKEYTGQIGQGRMAYLNERHRRVQFEKDFRLLQHTIKNVNDQNLKMTRDLERESVLVHHKDEMLKSKRQKTKDDMKAKEDWIVSLSRDVEKKRTAATFNPEVTMLENENLDLSSKVIRCEKEANIARAKVREMEMFLESRRRERQLEAQLKRDLMSRISGIKFQIDEQNKMNEVEIKKKVEDKEEKEKKDLNKEIDEVKTGKTVVKQRQQEKEDAIREMAQEKMGVQQDILALEQETSAFDKEFKEKSEVLILLKNSLEALTLEEKELEEKLEPVEKDVLKMKKLIPEIEKHNEELRDRIAHEEKKNELSMQIKNVNLEELMLLVQSNDQVQNTISDLMRKWDFLQRMNLGDA
jgi:chromosome segregation ATPase